MRRTPKAIMELREEQDKIMTEMVEVQAKFLALRKQLQDVQSLIAGEMRKWNEVKYHT